MIIDTAQKRLSFLDENSLSDREIKLMRDSTYKFDRTKTLSFSGHRPEKLPDDPDVIKIIKSYIAYEIESALEDGFDTFIMGGARGIDLWAGDAVIKQQKTTPHIKLIAALPYFTSASKFTEHERFNYGQILAECEEVLYASRDYAKESMKKRNQFMVDNCSILVAFIKDMRSGTGQTIRLAEKAGVITHVHKLDDLNFFPYPIYH
jgi:uncharacterized phage-like protein YoqJ